MSDPARWLALALALGLAAAAFRARPSARAVTWAAAIGSALLSALYIPAYLRGGPRIIDATSYWLEARAIAEGYLAWPISEPEAATAGRFLVRDTLAAGDHLAVIFPPGYPAVLALGFLIGAPMAIGPLIALLLTLAVAKLARALAVEADRPPREVEAIEAAAAALAAASATLRYHTADTMSHGLAALCFTASVLGAVKLCASPRDAREGRVAGRDAVAWGILTGAALGLLVATRPVSGGVCAVAVALLLGRGLTNGRLGRLRASIGIGAAVLAAAPPIALLLVHQRAATGDWLRSAQSLYYAANDGPPGCFRYGFGAGIGCRLEHGPYVDHVLPNGFGLAAALHTTGVRLWMHAGDALNVFALGPLTVASVAWAARAPALRVLAVAPLLQVAAYAPFYFDGSYPGGGARFYVDALPLELVAIAFAAVATSRWCATRWSQRRGARDVRSADALLPRVALGLGAISLAGFALRGADEHALLRDRDGGAPMFDASFVDRELAARGPDSARPVVFVRSDHGFGLAFDPARGGLYDVARVRGDALDRLAMSELGARDAYLYEDAGTGSPRLVPYAPRSDAPIEAEALYPPVEQRLGWSFTRGAPDASGARELGVALDAQTREAVVVLALPRALAGRRVALAARGAAHVLIRRGADVVAEWDVGSEGASCEAPSSALPLENTDSRLLPAPVQGAAREPLRLEIRAGCEGFSLDALQVREITGG